jgi:CMP-N-acetylneuraminic acid synthetase
MTRNVAIVPMRHNSERVPGKNYRPLAGIPLYHHVVRMLSSVAGIDLIVIDTDRTAPITSRTCRCFCAQCICVMARSP